MTMMRIDRFPVSDSYKKKLVNLISGRRSFSGRLFLGLLPAFALSFTLFFFGPLDLCILSRSYISYSPFAVLPVLAAVMAAVFTGLALAEAIPGGKIHAFLVSAVTGLAMAVYIQGAFLNPDLGTMDGHSVKWENMAPQMLVNILIWFIILLIPHLIHYLSNRAWRRFVSFVPALLIMIQAVSLCVKSADQLKYDRARPTGYHFAAENMLKPGKKNNIAVFLLDTVSSDDIDAMLAKYPESLALFHDFTFFDNANSHYMFTVPSLVNLLTGEEWDCENVKIADYMNSAWHSEKAEAFYGKLREKGYERNFFMLLPEAAGDPSVLTDVFSNMKPSGSGGRVDRHALVQLIKLSFYRYFPLTMKPFFMIYTYDIANLISGEDVMSNEWDFVHRMNDTRLSAGKAENAFFFYYLAGAHLPYRLDDRGRVIISELEPEFLTNFSEKEEQLAGFFFLIEDYIRQLKEMELYDSTGIIILADHGNNSDPAADHRPIYFIRMPEEYHDSVIRNSAPITVQDCFLADVMSMTGEDGSYWGMVSRDVPDSPAERWTRTYANDSRFPKLKGSAYNIMREYRYTGNGETLTGLWNSDEYEAVPMIDSYY